MLRLDGYGVAFSHGGAPQLGFSLVLHTGQAPQPCRARVTSAIASCSSRVARSARGA